MVEPSDWKDGSSLADMGLRRSLVGCLKFHGRLGLTRVGRYAIEFVAAFNRVMVAGTGSDCHQQGLLQQLIAFLRKALAGSSLRQYNITWSQSCTFCRGLSISVWLQT